MNYWVKVKLCYEYLEVIFVLFYFDKEIRSCDFSEFINGDIVVIILVYGKVYVWVFLMFKVFRNEIMVWDLVDFIVEDISKIFWFYV